MRLPKNPIKRRRIIIVITFVISLAVLGIFANPQSMAYAVTVKGNTTYPFSVEGDLNPTNQIIYIGDICTDDTGAQILSFGVNGFAYRYNESLNNSGFETNIYSLTSGKNVLKMSPSDSPVVAIVTYTPQWKPQIQTLEITGLAKGAPSQFSIISTDRNIGQPISKSYMMIKSLDSDEIVYDGNFNGTNTTITIDDIGEYIAYISVFDGFGWSDTYFIKFGIYLTKQNKRYEIPKRTDFIVNVEQQIGQKSLIQKLLISDLVSGGDVNFFIISQSNERILKSHMLIRNTNTMDVVFDEVLNGSKATVHVDEIGNYVIFMEVFDGAVWSDTYYSEFTAFSNIKRDLEQWPTHIPASNVQEEQTILPLAFDSEDMYISSLMKKMINGYYSIYRHIILYGHRANIN